MAARHRAGHSTMTVVVFSGGRGSGVLSTELITNPQISLTLAINGYDDGASTGEVRRFLGDCLGPSDYRKNASRVAGALASCSTRLIELLDMRLPVGCTTDEARAAVESLRRTSASPTGSAALDRVAVEITATERRAVVDRLDLFEHELARTGFPFDFSDCSLGNLVFAGSFLGQQRRFNDAIDDYCGVLGVPAGVIDNVTDGTNAHLVALDVTGRLLPDEASIVTASRPARVQGIYLLGRPLDEREQASLLAEPADRRGAWLEARAVALPPNRRLLSRLATADLIIYAPGTQHSSLFPSYLTEGLPEAIARNTGAVKLFVTNIQADAEIPDASAVDIVDRALFYMTHRGRRPLLTPSLITHFLMNDPGQPELEQPYVPLGSLDALEDPRLIRIADYEDGVTGRHDAPRVLAPYIASLLGPDHRPRIQVYLHDGGSPNKLAQTLLEMVRGGIGHLPTTLSVLHTGDALDPAFLDTLPLAVETCEPHEVSARLCDGRFDYAILFESSGMYRGEDIVGLASQVLFLRLDAIWGSRRLSLRDIEEAYRLRYRHHWLRGVASRAGSHVLSVLYLLLFGRYISDSLCGVRAVRVSALRDLNVDPGHKLANHQLLAGLLRDRSDVLETPVRFLPLSPERVKRTSLTDGVRAALSIVARRVRRPRDAAGFDERPRTRGRD